MISRRAGWCWLLGVVSASALIGLAQQKTARLRSELLSGRGVSENIQELEVRKAQLLALQVSPAELAQLRREHEETKHLREALSKLGHQSIADELTRRVAANTRTVTPAETASHPESENRLQNQGDHSPKSTLASVIWAASTGNVEALTPLITFESASRVKAQQIFQGLPASVQADYGSPEKIYATLLAATLPLGITDTSAIQARATGDQLVHLSVRLNRRDGSAHDAEFTFRRTGEAWQLVIPHHIVEKYAQILTGPE